MLNIVSQHKYGGVWRVFENVLPKKVSATQEVSCDDKFQLLTIAFLLLLRRVAEVCLGVTNI
jgi:hypothetical protein